MITSEERLIGNRDSWFNISSYPGGMLQPEARRVKILENEGNYPAPRYCNVEVKQELDRDGEEKGNASSDAENDTPCSHPSGGLMIPDYIKVEMNEVENHNVQQEKIYSVPQPGVHEMSNQDFRDENYEKYQKFQAERIKQIYSLLYPRYLQSLAPNLGCHAQVNGTPNTGPPVEPIKSGKHDEKVPNINNSNNNNNNNNNNNLYSLRFQLTPWETERVLRRREQNRKRKALQRAQETEEQRNLRREKERLAKAALRATEPLEKRMIRRERDRIAKAISRAAETDEQRRVRREKNRIAMAALRAAQTEEQRFIRREKDRIKKATMRAFETDEQRRTRREKNRVAMAIRRANLSERERSYLRNVNRIAKAASRSCLTPEERALMMMEAKLARDAPPPPSNNHIELQNYNNPYPEPIKQDCLNRIENRTGYEQNIQENPNMSQHEYRDDPINRDYVNRKYIRPVTGCWEGGTMKNPYENPCTSNQNTSMSFFPVNYES